MASNQYQQLPKLGPIEEDDEFEDFDREDWPEAEEDHTDVQCWIVNWDDTDVDDDFTRQLRAELSKPAAQVPTNPPSGTTAPQQPPRQQPPRQQPPPSK
ncbi:hypothetical protein SeMB42_g04363 [Synchytrium endobioticum]|uniref:26S proteasome complex subunit SEM1 n=1 Tax=Synchytrium endobioticum TaxID=286115 RepID=A0A507CWA0_9FUNG|nr:hypothetical protein SeLEV6574_g05066 [Synchytrium endobioticum]TPX44364.1 hypothetical protein SeMB42_g04363 [Synchytrium endobioticum]